MCAVEWKKLGDVCEIYDGTHQTPNYTDFGVKFVSVENIYNLYGSQKYISYEDFTALYKVKPQKGDVLMTRIGDVGTCAIIDKDEPLAYYVSLSLLRPLKSEILGSYLKYIIGSSIGKIELRKKTLLTAVPIKINLREIGKIKLPIPTLAKQQEIVSHLDTFTTLISNLESELDMRRKQYEHYRNQLLDFEGVEGVEWKTIEDIAEIGTGSSNTKDELDNGLYPFFVRSQQVRWQDKYEYDETAIITSGDGVGVGKIFHYIEGKYALHQRAYRIHILDTSVVAKYVYNYMKCKFYDYIMMNAYSSSVTSVRRPMLLNFEVPIPSSKAQQEIVEKLDAFENLIQSLDQEIKLRQKQYEYYREKLLTFEKE